MKTVSILKAFLWQTPHDLFLLIISFCDSTVLNKRCKHFDAWENTYTDAIKFKSMANAQADGYVFRLPIYVQGVRDAHILLSHSVDPDPNNGYEICKFNLNFSQGKIFINVLKFFFYVVIGGWGNLRTLIRKNGEVIAETDEYNVLNEFKPIKVLIEMTRGKLFSLFYFYASNRLFERSCILMNSVIEKIA